MALRGRRLLLNRGARVGWRRAAWRGGSALVLASVAAAPSPAKGGAWTQMPGRFYARISYASLESRVRFNDRGDPVGLEAVGQPLRGTEYRSRELRLYGEYGLTASLTIYGSTAYKWTRLLEPQLIESFPVLPEARHGTDGIGDVYLGGRIRLLSGPAIVSMAGEAKVPSGYSTRANPSLGNGQADLALRGLVGASAGWIYSTADAGWTHRGGSYSDEVTASIELGGRVLRDYSWRGVARGVRSVGNGTARPGEILFDPALASPRSLDLGFTIGDEIAPGIDLEAGITHVASGRNTLAGNTLEVGLAWSSGRR